MADLPEWLEELPDNLGDTELSASAHSSQESNPEHPTKVATKWRKHSIYTHFPKWPRLRRMLENQNNKGSLQKTHWRSSTSCRKVWWLDNGWSQSPQWGMWIKRQSPVRCRGTRSCCSMDSVLSVWNKIFTWDGKKVRQNSWSRCANRKLSSQTTRWNLGKRVKVYHGITALQHFIDPRQMASLKEPFDE